MGCCNQGGGYRRKSSWCTGDDRCLKLGGWCACTNHPESSSGKGCVRPDPVFKGKAKASWERIGSVNRGQGFEDHFEKGTSVTSGNSVTEGQSRSFSTSVEAGLEFPGMSVSAKVTSTYEASVSTSVSFSGTKSEKKGCQLTAYCDDPSIIGYYFYQWTVKAPNGD